MIKWIFAFVCVLPFMGHAQQDSKRLKNELQLTVGLNSSQAFEFDPSYSYMFHKNMGVIGGVRFVKEVVDNLLYDLVGVPVYQWRLNEKKEVSALLLRSAIRLKFPIINEGISIVTEPGILLNLIPNEHLEFTSVNTETIKYLAKDKRIRNKGGRFLSYDMKTYLSVVIDNWGLLFGYNLSTFDVYSGRRNIVIEGDPLHAYLPSKRKFTHTGFVGISYFF